MYTGLEAMDQKRKWPVPSNLPSRCLDFRLDVFGLFDQAAGRASFANLINRKYKDLIQAQCTPMIMVLEQILAGNRCVTFFGASVCAKCQPSNFKAILNCLITFDVSLIHTG